MKILGIFHSFSDPSAALLDNANLRGFVEEERLIRIKHAERSFPIQAVDYLLSSSSLNISDIDYIAQAWDCKKYDDQIMARRYADINQKWPTSECDLTYQRAHLNSFSTERQKETILRNLRRQFGNVRYPEIRFVQHHLSHACPAFYYSGFEESLVLTIDGCGEDITTAWWHGKSGDLTLIKEIYIPHSLGWLYSAFTEYLGFEAYDGEYKVMGLAAYGNKRKVLASKLDQLVWSDGKGGFETNPMFLSRGPRHFSYYFPDSLANFLDRPPRSKIHPIDDWHKDCAFAVQAKLEGIVFDMVAYWTKKTGIRRLCVSGGVGLNVKMNGNLFASGLIDDLFIYPLCADSGQSIGAALALQRELSGLSMSRTEHLYLGPEYTDSEIEQALVTCKLPYVSDQHIEKRVAQLLTEGKVVGWFQGRMEGGPRALGARSILSDPRDVRSRDKVNSVIKYREPWRPFCPSMTAEAADMYFEGYTRAPFMILTFKTNERARREIPAVVHVDGTCRPQVVDPKTNPRFYRLIEEFKRLTGIPAVLNTSFNIKGEPIVCSPYDAIRTFSATGMDVLAIGNFLVKKDTNT